MTEKFEEKAPEITPEKQPEEYDKFEKKGELYVPKEERGHVRSAEEVEKIKEFIPEDKKLESGEEKGRKAKEEYDAFHGLGTRGKEKMEAIEKEMVQEKKAIESAEIPKKGMETKEILKEVGIQKPAESFKEVQERLDERLDKTRTFEGKKLSEADQFVETRKFYLEELGYSVKYKGVLLDKAEILDENGKGILNDKGKALEFKSFYFNKTEAQINNFLKGRLQEKFEEKTSGELWTPKEERGHIRSAEEVEKAKESIPEDKKIESAEEKTKKAEAKGKEWRETFYKMGGTRGRERTGAVDRELAQEEKLDKGYQKTVKEAENAQSTREAKISFLQETKTLGKEKWGKLTEGIARLNLREKWGIGLKEGKKLAVEGGKDLAVIGLTPLAAVEEASRKFIGNILMGRGSNEKAMSLPGRIKELEDLSSEKRPEDYTKLLETLQTRNQRAVKEWRVGTFLVNDKGKIIRLLESWGGRERKI